MDSLITALLTTGSVQAIVALIALAVGFVASITQGFDHLYARRRLLRGESGTTSSYQDQVQRLVNDLLQASRQTDQLLTEITDVTHAREQALLALEQGVSELSTREQTLQTRVSALKNEETSTAVAQYVVEQMDKSERRSASRDYILFASGVLVSTVISIALRILLGI